MKKATAQSIMIAYLRSHAEVYYHDIEREIRGFGLRYFDRLYNVSTYTRAFRKIKELGLVKIKATRNDGNHYVKFVIEGKNG